MYVLFRSRNENLPAYRSTPPTGQATVITRNRPAAHLMTSDDYVTSSALVVSYTLMYQGNDNILQPTPGRPLNRLGDDTGTSSSRTSDKTSSSGDARDTDSDGEVSMSIKAASMQENVPDPYGTNSIAQAQEETRGIRCHQSTAFIWLPQQQSQ